MQPVDRMGVGLNQVITVIDQSAQRQGRQVNCHGLARVTRIHRSSLSTLRSWPSQISPPLTYSPPSRSSTGLGRTSWIRWRFYGATTPVPSQNTAYPLTACRSANICLTCSCPASRANFSVTYAHVAVHPQEQVGRLTSRLPNFSGRTVTLWITLMIFRSLHKKSRHSIHVESSPS